MLGAIATVDPWFIVANDPENSLIIKTARLVNNQKPKWIVSRVTEAINNENLLNPKIACLGLAFKPGIDDLGNHQQLKFMSSCQRNMKEFSQLSLT